MSRAGTARKTTGRPRLAAASRKPRCDAKRRPAVDIIVASHLWSRRPGARSLVRRAINAAAAAVASSGEVAVLLTDDASIRTMNREWRHKNVPTNVLSFPSPATPASRTATPLLGDIVIAYETTEREARDERKAFAHHLAHLAIHGFLHLLGYDHVRVGQAERMEELEVAILAHLDVPDPYAGRAVVARKA